jgi:hypothetical protein
VDSWWNTTEIDGNKITTGTLDANRIIADTVTVDHLNFSTIERRNAFASGIGTILLAYTSFMQDFFARANAGQSSTVLYKSESSSICVDHYIWGKVWRDTSYLYLQVYGTNPSNAIGANCNNSQGVTYSLYFPPTARGIASGRVSVSLVAKKTTYYSGGSAIVAENPVPEFSFLNFESVPLAASAVAKRANIAYDHSGSETVSFTYAMLSSYVTDGASIIHYNGAMGGMATQIGRKWSITINVTASTGILGSPLYVPGVVSPALVRLPIGVYALETKDVLVNVGNGAWAPAVFNTSLGPQLTLAVTDSTVTQSISIIGGWTSAWSSSPAFYPLKTTTTINIIKVG